jgi:hypothetical protein
MCHLLRTGRGHFNKGDFTYAKSRQLFDFSTIPDTVIFA